jgi:putative transposase
MVHFRRNRVPGVSYFFTVALKDRSSRLLVDSIDCFRRAYATMLHQHPFQTIAIAILPDHLHAIWKLPETDSDYLGRWRALKSISSAIFAKADWKFRSMAEALLGAHDPR